MEQRDPSSLIVNGTNIDDVLTQENEAIVRYPQNYSLGPTSLRRDHLYVNIYLIYMNVIVNGKYFFLSSEVDLVIVMHANYYQSILYKE